MNDSCTENLYGEMNFDPFKWLKARDEKSFWSTCDASSNSIYSLQTCDHFRLMNFDPFCSASHMSISDTFRFILVKVDSLKIKYLLFLVISPLRFKIHFWNDQNIVGDIQLWNKNWNELIELCPPPNCLETSCSCNDNNKFKLFKKRLSPFSHQIVNKFSAYCATFFSHSKIFNSQK